MSDDESGSVRSFNEPEEELIAEITKNENNNLDIGIESVHRPELKE